MMPNESDMQYCIYHEGEIVDGAHGLAIGSTAAEAWARALDPCEPWTIERSKAAGCSVVRCAIMVINPPAMKES